MNQFTNNAYEFINTCIGNNYGYKINIQGDVVLLKKSLSSLFNEHVLKEMIITDIEIQKNEIWLIVKKQWLNIAEIPYNCGNPWFSPKSYKSQVIDLIKKHLYLYNDDSNKNNAMRWANNKATHDKYQALLKAINDELDKEVK